MGYTRWGSRTRYPPALVQLGRLEMGRYAPQVSPRAPDAWQRARRRILFFDQLSPHAPAVVPAGRCQPVWITVAVPRGAAPGRYAGTLNVTACGRRFEVPVRLQVIDWALPAPKDFQTIVACEQSPYGVALAYNVKRWGDAHFRLLEPSMRLLGQVGNDFLVVPLLAGSEFGNGNDSMVRWRKTPGGWACDFAVFERYLDLALKHFKPRCVCFVVSHATDNNLFVKPRVVLADGSLYDVPPPGGEEAVALWKPLVAGLRRLLAARGILGAWHWGYMWDTADHRRTGGYVAGTIRMLAELAPGVGWARGCHRPKGRLPGGDPYTFVGSIYGLPRPVQYDRRTHEVRIVSLKGWKNPRVHLALPRVMNTVLALKGYALPFGWRLVAERAILAGGRGVCRLGCDYWCDAYQEGWAGGGQVGMSIVGLFWPGRDGAEAGARFEALREGLQETETRIFLERRLEDTAFAASPLGKRVAEVLERRVRETLFMPQFVSVPQISEYYVGWRRRVWDLFAVAAEVAGRTPPSAREKADFFAGTQ
jgi:hypothetical protein